MEPCRTESRIEPLELRLLLADPTVSISIKKPDASETDGGGAGLGQLTVRRAGTTAAALDVNVRISPGASTATSGADFEPIVKRVRIRAGRAHAHFSLIPIDDALAEANESVVVKVFSGAYEINPARPKVRVRIADNEPTVGVFRANPTTSEANPDEPAVFTVRRTGSTARALEVGYYVRNTSTATSGEDFDPLPATIAIPAGQREASFSLTPIDDSDIEGDETVVVTLRFDAGYHRRPHSATAIITDDEEVGTPGWWDDAWDFRVPISVSAGTHARSDKPVERGINFTTLLSGLGQGGALIENSIRVIETSADGMSVIDEDVPFQFDRADDFDATGNAAGTIVFIVEGTTVAGSTRHFHVYFDNAGTFSPPNVAALITTTDDVMDEGQQSVRVATQAGTYFFQKQGGGFSSLVDAGGNDWISFNPEDDPGSAGIFRGLPNTGEAFHPGFTDSTTSIVSQGPIKTVLEAVADGGARTMRWEFFPTYARGTMVENADPYYFLYEGTPGGAIDGGDTVVRSDGTVTGIDTSWSDIDGLGSENGEEWAYFRDAAVGRFLFLAHDHPDAIEDSYFDLDDNMTVFGFGRRNEPGGVPTRLLTAANNSFTIGLRDGGGAFSSASATINAAYRPVSTTVGAPQRRP